MSAGSCSSWKSRGARSALPSPISLPAGSALDKAVYFVEQRLGPENRDLRSRSRAASRALLLRSGQYGGARRNSDRLFFYAVAWEQTTESESRFKFVGAPGARATIYSAS